jgi:hypothetical protein
VEQYDGSGLAKYWLIIKNLIDQLALASTFCFDELLTAIAILSTIFQYDVILETA